jgi:putative transposase
MKINFSHLGLAPLCDWFGITRQAYYQNSWKAIKTTVEEDLIIQQINQIRILHPRMGTRKLYEKLKPFLLRQSIKMGRDQLFNLLAANRLLIRKRKRRIQTTQSFHWLRKYPNLIKDVTPTAPNQLWVSDITYWKIKDSHVYISFITDAYSRKIIGFNVANTLEAKESTKALKMALKQLVRGSVYQLIHHSDRGLQYCSSGYVKLLKDYQIQISMTENGDPLENAIAERLNGILKEEYLNEHFVENIEQAKVRLKVAVNLYNTDRPHMSIGNATPDQIHNRELLKMKKLWKSYFNKSSNIVNQCQD